MNHSITFGRRSLGAILAATCLVALSPAYAAPAKSARATKASAAKVRVTRANKPAAASRPTPGTYRPSSDTAIAVGRGQLVNLPSAITDIFVANEAIADVQVKSATQLYVFGKSTGETSIYATSASGAVVYSTNVRVGNNFNSLDQMLKLAMPGATIEATTMNGMVLLTGTVKSPDDVAEAERLVQAFSGDGMKVISRLRTATPLQVNLQVKIAEVSRSLVKEFGANLMTRDSTNGFQIGLSRGDSFGKIVDPSTAGFPMVDVSARYGLPTGTVSLPFDVRTGQTVLPGGRALNLTTASSGAQTSIAMIGHLLGLDVATAINMAESEGLFTTLAQPNLTALSGETASFLAGGEIPIPLSTGLGQVSVEYKQYGVSLAFTPVVLDNGRISMRVRPEVSELTSEGAVRLNGFAVPGITTRRTETTVELGSGQSFMIAGLMRNNNNGTVDRTPGAGSVPVLGALFRSQSYRRNETELVIIVTPYLVEPVNANDIALPTDGYQAPNDIERILLGKLDSSKSGVSRPKPTMAPSAGPISAGVQGAQLAPIAPPESASASNKPTKKQSKATKVAAAPGFSGN